MDKPSNIAFRAMFAAPDDPPPDVFVDHPVTNWYQGWHAACRYIQNELLKLEEDVPSTIPEGWSMDPGLPDETAFLYPSWWNEVLGDWPSKKGLQAETYDQYYKDYLYGAEGAVTVSG